MPVKSQLIHHHFPKLNKALAAVQVAYVDAELAYIKKVESLRSLLEKQEEENSKLTTKINVLTAKNSTQAEVIAQLKEELRRLKSEKSTSPTN